MIPRVSASGSNYRRLLSVEFRGADKDTGNRTFGACAVLQLITTKLLAAAAFGDLRPNRPYCWRSLEAEL